MSEIVDRRVVSMEMDNEQFKREAEETIKKLEKLEKSVDTKGMEKNLSSLEKVSSSINLDGLNKAIETINSKFSTMGTIADQVLRNITNSAIEAGKRMLKALSVEPLMDGLSEYETEINAVKLIMANLPGVTQGEVNDTLAELNEYADLTVYNFGQMTDAIGKFTAAGVDLKQSATAVKGLANIAAGAGTTNARLAGSYIQVAQALQSGVFMAQDWNSLVQAQMGNKEFREQLQQTAIDMGLLTGKVENFKDSLKNRWLTSEVFIKTLERAASVDNEWGKRLTAAATEVTTLTQLIGVLKEALGTAWATSFKYVIGDFTEAKALFTGISNILTNVIGASSEARNIALKEWHDMGGREELLKSLANLFGAIYTWIKPIKMAFDEVFESITGSGLMRMTRAITEVSSKIVANKDVMNALYNIAKVLATALKAVFTTIKMGLGLVGNLVMMIASALQGALILVGNLAYLVIPLTEVIRKSKIFQRLMTALSKIANNLSKIFINLLSAVVGFVSYVLQLPLLGDIFELLYTLAYKVADAIVTIVEAIANFDIRNISGWFSDLGNKLSQIFSFSKEFKLLENIIKGFGKVIGGVFAGIIGLIGSVIGAVFDLGIEFRQSFSMFNVGEALGGGIVGALSFIISSFRQLGAGIKSAFSEDKTGQLHWFVEEIIRLKDTIVSAIGTIVKELSKINWGKLFAATMALGMLATLHSLAEGLQSVGDGIEALGDAAKILSKALKKKFAKTSSNIAQIAILVGTITAAIKVISDIPENDLKKAMASLGIITGIIAAFEIIMFGMEFLIKKLKLGVRMQMATKSIAAIGIAVAAMAASLWLLKDVPSGWDLVGKMAALLYILTTFAAVVTLSSRFGGNKLTNFLSILAFAFAIDKIMDVFAKFANIPMKNIKDNLKNFVALMAGMSLLFIGMGQIKLGSVYGLIAMAYNIDLILAAFKKIGDADLDGLKKQILGLSPLLIALGGLSLAAMYITRNTKFGGGLATVGAGVIGIAIGVGILVAALNLFPKEGFNAGPFAELITSLVIIFGGMVTLYATIGHFNKIAQDGKGLKGATSALLSMSVLLAAIGVVLTAFALIKDPGDILAGMGAVGGIIMTLAAMTAMISKIGSGKKAVGTITAMILELLVIAGVLGYLMKFDWGQLVATSVTIVGVITALAVIAQEFTKRLNSSPARIAKSMATLTAMTVIFGILGLTLGALNRVAPDAKLFVVQAASITGALIAMGLVIGLLSRFGGENLGEAGSALMKVSIGVAALAAAMALMGAVDLKTSTIVAFSLAVAGLTAVFGAFLFAIDKLHLEPALEALSTFVNGISDAVFKFGKTAAMVGVAVLAFAGALKLLSTIGQQEQQNITNTFAALGTGVISAVGAIIVGLVDLISMGIYTLVYNAVETIKHILSPEDAELISLQIQNGVISIIDSAGNAIAQASLNAGLEAKQALEQNMPGEEEGAQQAKSYTTSYTDNTKFDAGQKSQITANAQAGVGYFVDTVTNDVGPKSRSIEEEAAKLPEAETKGLTTISASDSAEVREAAAEEVNTWYNSAKDSLNETEKSLVKDWKTLDDVTSTNMLMVLKHIYEDGNQVIIDANEQVKIVSRTTGQEVGKTIQDYFGVVDGNLIFYSEQSKDNAVEAGKKPWDGFVQGFVDEGNKVLSQIGNFLGTNLPSNPFEGTDAGKVIGDFYKGFLPGTGDDGEDSGSDAIDEYKQSLDDLANQFSDTGKSAGGASKKLKEFEDTVVEIPDANTSLTTSMNKFIEKFALAQATVADPAFLEALGAGYSDFVQMQYEAWASTDEGIQTIKEEEEEIERLSQEAMEAGVEFDAEAKRAEYRLRDMSQAWLDLRNNLVETVQSQIDIFSEFDKKTELSADKLLENMKSQIEGVKEWANNLTLLAQRGISDGLLQKLSEMGPQGYEYVHAFVQMTADQLQQANNLYSQSLALPQSTADQLLANYVYVGTMTSGGFQTGIEEGTDGAVTACETMGYAGLAALKNALLIASPSQETYAVGQFFVQGMQDGITSFEEMTVEQVRKFAERLIWTAKDVFTLRKFEVVNAAKKISTDSVDAINKTRPQYYDAGVNLVQGLIEGMNSMAGQLAATAEALALSTLSMMTGPTAFDENSPSKATFKIGNYATQGLINGLNSEAQHLDEASTLIGNSAVANLKNAILAISNGIESDIDMDPTIRPVLDLSRVIPQAQRINTLFSRNLAIRASTDFSGYGVISDGNGTTVAGSQYVFNQYNTSPKALDRADIYRQTHNQFAWFKGMTQ